MATALANIFFWLTLVLAAINVFVTLAWKRKDVSITEASIKFPFKYGIFWCWIRPELYFEQAHARPAWMLTIVCLIAFLTSTILASYY